MERSMDGFSAFDYCPVCIGSKSRDTTLSCTSKTPFWQAERPLNEALHTPVAALRYPAVFMIDAGKSWCGLPVRQSNAFGIFRCK
jgi:hypothetical protein